MSSIRRILLVWLSLGFFVGIVIAAGLVYIQAREEANELFDYQMAHLATSLPSEPFVQVASSRTGEADDDIVVQIWDNTGQRIYRSHEDRDLPRRAEPGFSNVSTRAGAWRIYSTQLGDTVVQLAQPDSARRDMAAQMAMNTVAPLLILFPFLGLVLWVTVGRGLSQVRRVAVDVQSRDASTLTPISEAGLPREIRPLTRALNDLLNRLGFSIDAHRSFVADAAHELRTPLTAVKLQAELAERATTETERRAAFADLQQGLERATHLVEQLLTLARQEASQSEPAGDSVDLCALATSVVAQFAPTADLKDIDLGLTVQTPASVTGNADALRTLLSNVVDNAIRHTPERGRIDVSIEAGETDFSIIVQDGGPGIPEADLARVFDRFYRAPGNQVTGSGLGLAIVKRIADAHGAAVTLMNTGNGLRVRVAFSRTS